MSGDRALAGRLVVGLEGPSLTDPERDWLLRWRPAGVILFSRNVTDREQLTNFCAGLHALDPALEIVADHEGGPVSQLQEALGRPPSAWTLGTLDDVDLTRRVHRETARRCLAVGVDRVLAPCCDVLVEPRNPVIGSRAFGASTALVERHAAAAATGLIEGGVRTCAKHWPGHGGSRIDSHLGLARVGAGALPEPFEAVCMAGGEAVMVGHLLCENDKSPPRPASLDPQAVSAAGSCGGAARQTWADDVTMGALRDFLGGAEPKPGVDAFSAGMLDPAQLTLGWLQAVGAGGCDRLLIRGIPWSAFPLCAGVAAGTGSVSHPVDTGDAREFDEDPYTEARRRAGRLAGVGEFGAPDGHLAWIDLTDGDRWQGARPDVVTGQLLIRLERDFDTVRRYEAAGPAAGSTSPPDRLLVSSHRPLPQHFDSALADGLAETGRCLVLGHPSLAADLTSRLPRGWAVGSLSDATAEDYIF